MRSGGSLPCLQAPCPKLQDEHKICLHFQNDTESKCGMLRTSHLHQSIEKLWKFCTQLRLNICSASHTADVETIIKTRPEFCVVCPQRRKLRQLLIRCLNSGKDCGTASQEVAWSEMWRSRRPSVPRDVTGFLHDRYISGKVCAQVVPNSHM